MKGTMVILAVDGTEVQIPIHGAVRLDIIKNALNDGLMETVPYFNSITVNGENHPCVAFCDEEGKLKQLPVNVLANSKWVEALHQHGLTRQQMQDILVGPIVVLYGDKEFMRSL